MTHDDWIEVLRSMVRPTVTWGTLFATIIMLFLRYQIPEQWWSLLIMVLTFWFADRTQKKAGQV